MRKNWVVTKSNHEVVCQLAQAAGISETLAHLLVNRQIDTKEAAKQYLGRHVTELSSPYALLNMGAAIERIQKKIAEQAKIVVYGDYDVDGICASVILYHALERLGGQADIYIPDRLEEGYGLNQAALEELLAQGCALLITVDCGVSSADLIADMTEKGLEIIVTDHHQLGAKVPGCLVINPALDYEEDAPWSYLSGAGIAFQVAHGLLAGVYAGVELEEELANLIDLAAIATVADLVPLVGDNRIIVAEGLAMINSKPRLGIKALIAAASPTKEEKHPAKVLTAGDIAFQIAPRLNACGRLGDAMLGVELLLSEDEYRAAELAEMLDGENQLRKEIESNIFQEAIKQIEEMKLNRYDGFILLGDDWHPGVIGIVASKIVERYHTPTILLTRIGGLLKGSGRSVEGFHLQEALLKIGHLFTSFGGHSQAAGVTLAEENYASFVTAFRQEVCQQLQEANRYPTLRIDYEVPIAALTRTLLEDIEALAPVGMKNRSAVLALRRQKLEQIRFVGAEQKHLKIALRQDDGYIDGIGFSLADAVSLTNDIPYYDIAFHLELNKFRQQERLQMVIKDIKPSYLPDQVTSHDRYYIQAEDFLQSTNRAGCGVALGSSIGRDWLMTDLAEKNGEQVFGHLLAAIMSEALPQTLVKEVGAKLFSYQNLALTTTTMPFAPSAVVAYALARSATERVSACLICPSVQMVRSYYNVFASWQAELAFSLVIPPNAGTPASHTAFVASLGTDGPSILLITERYWQKHYKDLLAQDQIRLFALCNCGCIVSQGQGYSKSMLMLSAQEQAQVIVYGAMLPPDAQFAKDQLEIFSPEAQLDMQGNRQLIDQRNTLEKLAYLDDLIKQGNKTLVYVHDKRTAIALSKLLRTMGQVDARGRIAYCHEGLPWADQAYLKETFAQGNIACLIVTPALALVETFFAITHLVIYHLPVSLSVYQELLAMHPPVSQGQQIHLLYGEKDAKKMAARLAQQGPDRQALASLYRFLQQHHPVNTRSEIDVAAVTTLLTKDLGYIVDQETLAYWLGIFQELDLLTMEDSPAKIVVQRLPFSGKLSLQESVRFCEGQAGLVAYQQYEKQAFAPLGELEVLCDAAVNCGINL